MPTQMIEGSLVATIDRVVSRAGAADHPAGPEGAKLSLTKYVATIGGTVRGGVRLHALVPRYRPPAPPMPPSP